jgi:hypothetical protein
MHYGQLSIGNNDVFKDLRYWYVINHNCSVSIMINSEEIAVKLKNRPPVFNRLNMYEDLNG